MADYVTKIRTSTGDKQIDYNALANLPDVAILGSDGKVSTDQLPSMDYIPTSEKGTASGVATLDSSGKIPSAQLPSMNYIPTSQKGAASGVAPLNSSTKIDSTYLPTSSSTSSTSTTTIATSSAVKTAYDKAVDAYNKATSALTIETGTYTIAIPSLYSAYSITDTTQKYVKIGDMLFLQLKTGLSTSNSSISAVLFECSGFPSGSFSARHICVSNIYISGVDTECRCEIDIDTSYVDNQFIAIAKCFESSDFNQINIDTVIPIIVS